MSDLMMWQQSQTPVDTGTSFLLSQLEVLEALGVPAVLFAVLLFLCGMMNKVAGYFVD